MGLWFNDNTGDLKYAYNSKTALELKRAGYWKVMSTQRARFFHFFVLKTRVDGKYVLEIINKDNPHHYPIINPANYEYFEDYFEDIRKLKLLREIDFRWTVAGAMLHNPQLLYEKLLKAIKRGKNISRPAFDFALSLLSPEQRQEIETKLIAKAFKQ